MSAKLFFLTIVSIFLLKPQQQNVEVLDFNGLKPYLSKENDTTYIINFWATWCGPCVKELPNFEKISADNKKEKIKVILVSLDFFKTYQKRLLPFISKQNIKSKVILLNDPDSNSWIEKVDKNWSGAIPATLIYKNQKKIFKEGELSYKELDSLINYIHLNK